MANTNAKTLRFCRSVNKPLSFCLFSLSPIHLQMNEEESQQQLLEFVWKRTFQE